MVKKITHQRLYNITLYYLSRYDSCTSKVREMLKRRILKDAQAGAEVPTEVNEWVETIIGRMQELGYIDDRRYVQNQIRALSSAGKSARFMIMKLTQMGIDIDLIDEVLNASEDNDLTRAKQLVRRKKMGYLRPENVRADFYQKDLATLGRAGFSYETAKMALAEDNNF
ncbi:MAG: RecX family transcriptional regulator [Alphaproteobacteria bacterium]|nr:RecX family transcriptional regulator [Alphaproteobacteria bacterium]